MSKKISSTSKSLGNYQLWFINFQSYGKNYKIFSSFFFNILTFLNFIIIKYFIQYNLFLSNKEIQISSTISKFSFNLFNIFQLDLYKIKNLINLIFKIYQKNFKKKFRFIFYFDSFEKSSIFFINHYIDYLFLNLDYNPKKIYNFCILFFKKKLNKKLKIITTSRHGLKLIELQGFKIQLKGRYELTKSAMSKTDLFKLGKITSSSLNNKVEFLDKVLYTKLGTSSLKIWLFYSIKFV